MATQELRTQLSATHHFPGTAEIVHFDEDGGYSSEFTPVRTLPRPNGMSIIRIADSYGVNMNSIVVDSAGTLISGEQELGGRISETMAGLRSHGIRPTLTIVDSSSQPELFSEEQRPYKSRVIILEDVKQTLRSSERTTLGFVRVDYDENDDIENVSYTMSVNPYPVSADSPEIFNRVNTALRDITARELHPMFQRVIEANANGEIHLTQEKITMLEQLSTLLGDAETIGLSAEEQDFLNDFEGQILNGAYDRVFRQAVTDTLVSVGLTQAVAMAGPAASVLIGAMTEPEIGAAIAAASYIGAPVPSWLRMMYQSKKLTGKFNDIKTVIGSFTAMNLVPVVGPAAAFPLSVNNQTDGKLGRFRHLLRKHPALAAEITRKEKVMDLLLFGRPEGTRATEAAHIYEIEDTEDYDLVEHISFNGNAVGVDIVTPKSEKAKHELARFVAEQHIKHKLSKPGDENIINVGTDENPIYEIAEDECCEADWVVVRDSKTAEIVVAHKMYRRKDGNLLPMQQHASHEAIEPNTKITDMTAEELLNSFDTELGSLAFNLRAIQRTGSQTESGYRMTLALLAWLRGVHHYMTENDVKEFGAIFTRRAFSYVSRLGSLGIESMTEPFHYMPVDVETHTQSEVIRLNLKYSQGIMKLKNRAIHDFIFNGLTNHEPTRKAIWREVINKNFQPSYREGLLKYAGKSIMRAYLNIRAGAIVSFKL
ncbi:MAG: hypothetical protein TR69_WS6001000794 [candidate division WS6 bacterium OLB20]|uniref:Uncharacterized protein n=1 Tax=candidate division WS6 bacterium OLB20 TaxID=1617426 RepID=A0A136LYQ1_9BACT|nr:MAG: hypothetical protein TR69_WS6001000794 [candidate division WS6 bacterium OLB20]